MASDLIAQSSDHALRNFPTRAMTIANEMMAKDGEIDAKDAGGTRWGWRAGARGAGEA